MDKDEKKRLDDILSRNLSKPLKQSPAKAVSNYDIGYQPQEMYNTAQVQDMMRRLEELRKHLETHIANKRPNDAFGREEETRTIYENDTATEPRTLGNLVKYVSDKGLISGISEFIHGRDVIIKKPVQVTVEKKKELPLGELRKKQQEYIEQYLTELSDYKDNLSQMVLKIDSSIETLIQTKERYMDQKQEALKTGIQVGKDTEELKGELKNIIEKLNVMEASSDEYPELEKYRDRLSRKIGDAMHYCKGVPHNHVFYKKAEDLFKAYEDSLLDVKRAGESGVEFLENYGTLVGGFLTVSKDTSEIAETMGQSIFKVEESMYYFSNLVYQTDELNKIINGMTPITENIENCVLDVDGMKKERKGIMSKISTDYDQAMKYVSEQNKPKKQLTSSPPLGIRATDLLTDSGNGNGADESRKEEEDPVTSAPVQ